MAANSTGKQVIYDPRGVVEAVPHALAPRVADLTGLRLGVLDNTKWNGGKLLREIVRLLEAEYQVGSTHFYRKESFSKNASGMLIAQMAVENDIALTAIGD
jgi:hypothetical protein